MVDGSSTEGHFWQAGLGKSGVANEKSFNTRVEAKEDLQFCTTKAAALTFSKVAKFSVRREAHVLFCREAVAVKHLRPRVALAGQDRSTAVPHRHTEAAARLDEPEGKQGEKSQTEDEATEKVAKDEKVLQDLRVQTDGSDEGAEEGLGLRVAARLQQGPPVL